MKPRRTASRRGRLTGGLFDGREFRLTHYASEGALLLEHWPRDGHRDAISIATFPHEDVLVHWLDAHGAKVTWQ